MKTHTVLISGAGIAGPTLAHGLAREGFAVTVLERAQGLRSSGNPVDVRGAATRVAKQMGVLPRLREEATDVTGLAFVTSPGGRVGPIRIGRPKGEEVEIPRSALAAILYDAVRDDTEFLFEDSIASMTQDAGGVDVVLDRAGPRRFDLVIGADGLHSNVRRLAFGPEADFVRHLGLYVATLPLGRPATDPRTVVMHNTPGRSVSVHPVRGTNALAAFIFRSPLIPGLTRQGTEEHKRAVTEAFAGGGWELPDLLERLQRAEDIYLDSVSRVRMPTWTRGRVTLLGDAASSLSLFGDGSSLAMAGAATLAESLAAQQNDHAGAFREYEARHRKLVKSRVRGNVFASALLVPATRPGIATRNLAARLLSRERPPAVRGANDAVHTGRSRSGG